ncbi:MAG: C1 family peptidase [Lachnospiraceae bacterium]|nr:C1 family peptidase [Lachnospiraceae bacterium]
MKKKKNASGLSAQDLAGFRESFNAERANLIAANAAVKNGVLEAAADYKAVGRLPHTFSVNLKQGKITNQKASGRCWIFSALNTFRFEVMQKYNLENFELSQNYMFFYDKLEKANYFLESVLKTVNEPINGRLYQFLNASPLQDGGQWDMLANLVRKYGVVPKEAYDDAASATNSRWFDQYLTTKLREDAAILRGMAGVDITGEQMAEPATPEELQTMKKEMMEEIYRMLCICLGEPPQSFDLTLRDKDDKVIMESGITPLEFFDRYVGVKLDDLVSIIHAPTRDKPFGKMYTVKFLGNVAEGKPVAYLNLEMDTIKAAVIKQLKDGHPVWFGSDCSKFSLRKEGIFDRECCKIEQLMAVNFEMDKEDAILYGDSAMNHAMVIMGVNLVKEGRKDVPNRWRIENSWGKDVGDDGYYVASDAWFDDYVYQVVVDKKYLDKKSRDLISEDYIELEPWDPFGSLAD